MDSVAAECATWSDESYRVLALVVIAAAGALYWFRDHPRLAAYVPAPVRALLPADDNAKAQPPAAAAPPRAAPPVETAMVEVGRVADEVEALGTLAANESVVIAPEIAGRVTRLGFKEGEPSRKDRNSSCSMRRSSRTRSSRPRPISIWRGTPTSARAPWSSAERGRRSLSNRRRRSSPRTRQASPSRGRVWRRRRSWRPSTASSACARSASAITSPSATNLITLTDIDPIKIDFRVPEIFLGQVRDGQTIEIRVDAIPDRTFSGQIYVIDPVVDVNGRAIRLRARAPNPDGALKPGLFARITIVTDAREDALMVPEAAVMPAGTGKAVYVVDNGKARLTKVEIGKRLRRQGRDHGRAQGRRPGRDCRTDAPPRRRSRRRGVRRAAADGTHAMSFFALFVRRPVLSTVLSLLVLLVGFVSYTRLTVREYPNIDEPVVSVRTTYPGASAEIIETQVTQILENSIAGIEGIETMTSQSRQESSNISVRFRPDVNPDVAASDVRDRVGRVRGRLPEEIDEPIIAKVEADAQPILYLSLTGARQTPLELTDFADRFITDRVQNVTGVAEVRILGERRYAMRVWLDRARLAAYNITVQEIEAALRAQNVEIPSGRIESNNREFTVLSQTSLTTPEQFAEIVVKDVEGFPVRLKNVARVELGAREERNAAFFGGTPSVTIGIVKQATANPLDVSDGVRAALPEIEADLPDGMRLAVSYDTSIFIDRSIQAVYTTIIEAVVLVVLIIFVFLRSVRATLIPLVTIPVSLIGAFALMYAFGFTVNTLTLLPWCSPSASWSTTPSWCSRTSSATSRTGWRPSRLRSGASTRSPSR